MLGPLQSLQPNNQQQQGQQQQPQPLQQGQLGAGIPPPPPLNGQDYTLSSVLHYLQTEWRRYERDRNEWEIERAEMRARIALLEGERRSFENVKLDLMRRIKMLEYALRMERSKQLTQPASSHATKLSTIQASVGSSQKEDSQSQKEESGGSSPRSEDLPLPDGRLPNGSSLHGPSGRPNSWSTGHWSSLIGGGAIPNLGKPPLGRDPKSRARSRDYLKQCLQEITYLTSPQAMNPLPNRPLMNNPTAPAPLSLPNVPSFDQIAYNGRPRKVLPDAGKEFPVLNGMHSGPSSTPPSGSASTLGQLPSMERSHINSGIGQQPPTHQLPSQTPGQTHPPPNPIGQSDKDRDSEAESRQVTAIFGPEDIGEWKEKPRFTLEPPEKSRLIRDFQPVILADSGGWDGRDDDEPKEDEGEVEDEEATLVGDGSTKIWKAKRTLRNHLDAVRALAFHPTELCLATGGDDCTVKIWRMDVASLASSIARATTEVEPQLTLRGHSAAITRLIYSPSKQLLYSASLDSSIRIWALPVLSHTTYAPYDETRSRGELVGHTDAVWDLALVRDEGTLISCGAEGSVKVWDVSGPSGGGSLKLTWGWYGVENPDDAHDNPDTPGATAVEAIKTDLKKVAVAYQSAVVKIFDIESGKELMRLESDMSYDGTSNTQINRIVSHPTMSLLVTAHEDKYIRIFDLMTGQCTHSMLAHLDGVTSLSIDASGFSLVSGSHDCSVRFWDLMGSRSCVQELTTHREKAREGVLDVEFHPSLPIMASGGADGVVKLYASS